MRPQRLARSKNDVGQWLTIGIQFISKQLERKARFLGKKAQVLLANARRGH